MNIFLTRKNLYLFVLVYAIFAIGYALYIEYYLNFEPCKLCLYQRVPFIFAIFVSFVGYNFPKKDGILAILITTFAFSFIISGYHYGIENSIFEEFKGCSNNSLNITNKLDLLNNLKSTLPSCKDITYTIFGISLAGINFLSSLILIIYSVRTLVYEKN